MSKPSFVSLRANYPDKIDMPPERLYQEIGRPDLSNDPNWKNTCAVRVSLALVKSGMKIDTGHMTIMTGKHKGSKIEQNQVRLSRYLSRGSVLGEPEKVIGGGAAAKGIGARRGIVSFFKLNGQADTQGHIDLVQPSTGGYQACASRCFWTSVEIWFWPLS